MYRLAIFLLSVFSLAVLVGIIAVVAWRDYEDNGGISPSRALRVLAAGWWQSAQPASHVAAEPAVSPLDLPHARSELLYLINLERVLAQVPPLAMGSNSSAQQHAESMMSYGYRSHWDLYGLTPQMRYTLAGGTNRVRQNIAGPVAVASNTAAEPQDWREVARIIHQGFMARDPERANMLDPWHRTVSIGVACHETRCWVVQQYETDHLEFNVLPTLSGTILEMQGEFRDGLELDAVALWHHPYPRRLNLGQLDATYRYGYGQRPVNFLRPLPSPGSHYQGSLVSYSWDAGIDPYSLDSGLPRSSAPPLAVEVSHSAAVSWTTADGWEQQGPAFAVEADLSETLASYGASVYTVQIWGKRGEERVPLSNYAIFVP